MPRMLAPLAVVAALTTLVHAGIKFTKPEVKSTQKAGSALTVVWDDTGSDGPAIADLSTYTLFLCAGGNDADSQIQLVSITPSGDFGVGNQAQGMVGTGVGDNTPANAYFLKMVAVSKTGGTVTVFSDRFSYSGMTGTFPDTVLAGLKTLTGTSGPDMIDQTVQDPADAQPDASQFDVEYTMQTGLTRYAPMQPVPPTKVTKKKATPQYPTSSVDIAKSKLATPKIQTTITQSQTHKASSMENTNAAAPMPSDDMAKFLNRWKD